MASSKSAWWSTVTGRGWSHMMVSGESAESAWWSTAAGIIWEGWSRIMTSTYRPKAASFPKSLPKSL